jgi:hypothetical protein
VKPVDCRHEDDVLDALTSGRWPDRADDALRAHVASCAVCTDIIEVAGAILEGRNDTVTDMRIPSSAVMWWRAQMRARQEAAREAARPIAVAQIVGAISAALFGIVAIVMLLPWIGGVMSGWMAAGTGTGTSSFAPAWVIPALVIGVSLLLAPVAIYFAVTDD